MTEKKMTASKAVKIVEHLAKSEGITVGELLARAGVDRTTWWAWQNNKRTPDKRTLLAIQLVSKAGV